MCRYYVIVAIKLAFQITNTQLTGVYTNKINLRRYKITLLGKGFDNEVVDYWSVVEKSLRERERARITSSVCVQKKRLYQPAKVRGSRTIYPTQRLSSNSLRMEKRVRISSTNDIHYFISVCNQTFSSFVAKTQTIEYFFAINQLPLEFILIAFRAFVSWMLIVWSKF